MSWNPFSRSGSYRQRVLSPEDLKSFEKDHAEIARLEKVSKKLNQDLKKARECQPALAHCNVFEAYNDVPALEALCTLSAKMEHLARDTDQQIALGFAQPLNRWNSTIFPSFHTAYKRWDQHLQEYAKNLQKIEKLQGKERSVQNDYKQKEAKRSVEQSRLQFLSADNQLRADMKLVMENRGKVMQPMWESLVSAQLIFYEDASRLCEEAVPDMSTPSDNQSLIKDRLNKIKALSITVDD